MRSHVIERRLSSALLPEIQRLRKVGQPLFDPGMHEGVHAGASSGYLSILVLALYVNSPDISHLYHYPKLVWALVPVMLYWISRIWMQTHRGQMHDDPLVYALKDKVSLLIGVVAALVLWLAV